MTKPAAPKHLPDFVAKIYVDVLTAYGEGWERIAGPNLEAYATQVYLVNDCAQRVAAEGTIIKGPKGDYFPHPAIEVGRKAQAEVRAWGDAFKPPRRSRR